MKWQFASACWILILLGLTGGSACTSTSESAPDIWSNGQWIDLTHAFDDQAVYWPTANGFQLDTVFVGQTEGNYYYSAFKFSGAEHGGTHLDAPVHFAEGKQSVDQIPLNTLTGEAVVVDVSDAASRDIDYLVTTSDLEQWESVNGRIPDDAIVLLNTGYANFWPDRQKYMGTDQRGPSAVLLLRFPGLSADAATWLVENRNIKAVGIDTPSIDFGRSSDFMTHRLLFAQNVPAFENLANLDALPAKGAYVIAMPMKIRNGSGAPLRIIARMGI